MARSKTEELFFLLRGVQDGRGINWCQYFASMHCRALCFLIKSPGARSAIIVATGVVFDNKRPHALQQRPLYVYTANHPGLDVNLLITAADFGLLFIILGIAFNSEIRSS